MDFSKILYLSGEQVHNLGADNMKQALVDVEETFKLVYKGNAILPEKISMGFGKTLADESTMGRINAMPGYLGGRFDMAGIKWIGSSPLNREINLPRASSIIILNDPKTKFPICLMNGSEISAVRTGASGGVAAKYLARKGAETLMLVGAGLQNSKQLEAIYCAVPTLKNFYVVDIIKEAAIDFAEKMGEKLNITIHPITKIADCSIAPDITVNASSAQVPVMDLSVARPGSLHMCVGGLDHPELYKKADKIFCDDWEQVRHRAACYLAIDGKAGKFDDNKVIYSKHIGEIICGDKPGRQSDSEFLYYKPVGMGIMDIAVATRIYKEALAKNIGTFLDY